MGAQLPGLINIINEESDTLPGSEQHLA